MRLNHFNLLPYLLGRSWLDATTVVAGDAVVIERRLRHTSFVVEQRSGDGVFVKQLHDPHPNAAASLRREAAFYRAVATGRLAQLAGFVPTFVGYDEHEHILALALVDGVSAQDRAVSGRPLNAVEAAALGTALAATHAVAAATARAAAPGALDETVPWAFHLAQFLAGSSQPLPGAGASFIGVLRSHPQLIDWLGQVAAWWRHGTLIHGDLKWENVLLPNASSAAEASNPGNQGRVRLIDWELAAVGDPAWDLATLVQAPLVRSALVLGQARALDRSDLTPHREALRALVGAWVTATRPHDPGQEYQRLLSYTAVRLVYSAYEHAAVSPQIHPAILAMVATAWQMLRDRHFADALLGFAS
ncbi:MAG: phosphotransferase [Acidobacteriota bacterium]